MSELDIAFLFFVSATALLAFAALFLGIGWSIEHDLRKYAENSRPEPKERTLVEVFGWGIAIMWNQQYGIDIHLPVAEAFAPMLRKTKNPALVIDASDRFGPKP